MIDHNEITTYEYNEDGKLMKKTVEKNVWNYEDSSDSSLLSVNVKKLDDWATIPVKSSDFAAGFDLFACPDNHDGKPIASILPSMSAKIRTGIAMSIPKGYFGAIYARSGLASKKGLRPANCVGVIDSDYRGEIIVVLYNDSDRTQIVAPKDRIAQIIISPYAQNAELVEVNELDETVRGDGGFGSTGT